MPICLEVEWNGEALVEKIKKKKGGGVQVLILIEGDKASFQV